jgi:hypothetical protein
MRVMGYVRGSRGWWADVRLELECSGRPARRRLRSWEEAGVCDRLHADLPRLPRQGGELNIALGIDSVSLRGFGGGG